ncbi:MAG TPA: 4-(cytidine 5'-diphospho)-2-C-methyl-D-erythritol kinase [Acidimicrobiia bacterium]|nr:4-(cytidine 5'-diphospho)-2-C-methyl-D-erythritol kinase [Acidimicrobiia bacterium]
MPESRPRAHAKLTLSLKVVGRRSDGYHDIDAVMVTVSEPHDSLVITPAARTSIAVTGPFADGVPTDDRNLVWRALDGLGVQAAVHITKGIPHGAGLGGGSADAAAVLRSLGGGIDGAAAIGADVPFCLRGGAARVRGTGELIEPIVLPARWVVIATPPLHVATADVYAAWDELGGPHEGVNELEAAAFLVEPELRAFKDAVAAAAARDACLAGSGSSFAVVFDEPDAARAAEARVRAAVGGWVWMSNTDG